LSAAWSNFLKTKKLPDRKDPLEGTVVDAAYQPGAREQIDTGGFGPSFTAPGVHAPVGQGPKVVAPSEGVVVATRNALAPKPGQGPDTAERGWVPPPGAGSNPEMDRLDRLQRVLTIMGLIRASMQGVKLQPISYDPWKNLQGGAGSEPQTFAGVRTGIGSMGYLGAGL